MISVMVMVMVMVGVFCDYWDLFLGFGYYLLVELTMASAMGSDFLTVLLEVVAAVVFYALGMDFVDLFKILGFWVQALTEIIQIQELF